MRSGEECENSEAKSDEVRGEETVNVRGNLGRGSRKNEQREK